MNYTKPEITSLASASFVIQGGKTYNPLFIDSQMLVDYETVVAYESDE
jgi:hypothetical protein